MKRTLLFSLILLHITYYSPEAASPLSAKKLITFPSISTTLEIGQNLVVDGLPTVSTIDEDKKPFHFNTYVTSLYQQIGLEAAGLSQKAFERAMIGYYNLEGQLKKKDIISIVDFDQASTKERLYVISIKEQKLLYQSLVAHGKNTGWDMATDFGNKHRSLKSSLGFLVTAETYFGKFGYALRLDGKERYFNDNARSRGIVMHGANYVNPDFVKQKSRLGRSYGCPALPYGMHEKVINAIKGGSLFYIHKSNENYEKKSKLLDKSKAEQIAAKLTMPEAEPIIALN
ncbi:MAG: murein L,D-transpeptidase catalytic domain family protein [Flammeovirgaceae bacterium]